MYQDSLDQPPLNQPPLDQPPLDQPTLDQPPLAGTLSDAPSFGGSGLDFRQLAQQALSGPASGITAGQVAATPNNTELGELISNANSVQGVAAQRRAQTAFTPVIRGFKEGQLYTQSDGAYWLPARQDLDTILSKLDPADIENVIILEGPYGLRYGPAFSYVDVIRKSTPRYNCPEVHNRMGLTYLANGDQFYARDSVYGGGPNYGFRFNYGHRLGSDYRDGDGDRIPSSYGVGNVIGDVGFDLSPYQRVELGYQRLDVGNTEYYLQAFNLDYMVTNGWNLRLIDEDPTGPWTRMTLDGWANRSRFDGSLAPWTQERFGAAISNRILDGPPPPPANWMGANIVGFTNGVELSSGGRVSATFGELDDPHVNAGADFRYIQQSINEFFTVSANDPAQQSGVDNLFPDNGTFYDNLPRSWLRDAGVFLEYGMPVGYWTPTVGVRVDFIDYAARASELRPNSQLVGRGSLDQDYTLYSFYMTNDVELDRNWTGHASFGHGQRPATLTERYADGLFLSVAQSGFTRVIGFPEIGNETNWQCDLGIDCDYDYFRAGLRGYYAWVFDYITFQDNVVPDLVDARLLNYINTRLATLAGFSFNCELDLTDRVTPFATMYYIEGQDTVIDQPLPQIPPLDTRLGLRFHDPDGGQYWGIEFFARVVDNQDRLGTIRRGANSLVTIEQETPGFTTFNLRGYYNWSPTMHFVAGIDNLFDRNYLEHLDTRLTGGQPMFPPAAGTFPALFNFRPGFTPYAGFEWIF